MTDDYFDSLNFDNSFPWERAAFRRIYKDILLGDQKSLELHHPRDGNMMLFFLKTIYHITQMKGVFQGKNNINIICKKIHFLEAEQHLVNMYDNLNYYSTTVVNMMEIFKIGKLCIDEYDVVRHLQSIKDLPLDGQLYLIHDCKVSDVALEIMDEIMSIEIKRFTLMS